jgi:hypothetical protein
MEQMETEVVETVAGVVRLLRRAAELAWIEADEGGSQVIASATCFGNRLGGGRGILPVASARPAGWAYAGGAGPSRASCFGGTVVAPDLCCGCAASPVGPQGALVAELIWEANSGAGA